MEEEDQDDLLQCTDDESLSETEEQCLPIDNSEETYRNTIIYFTHTKLDFVLIKAFLILSVTALIIVLPLYLESINIKSDAYTLILTNTTISTIILIIVLMLMKLFSQKYKNCNIFNLPLKKSKLFILTGVYVCSGFMIIYSHDRKRVLCHLQDPIKGIVLVCSLLYYFFFCKKLMGLQRIFSATTIIVGLFIAVDYGLCDEFRCRGYEREKVEDDTGKWSWQAHSVWISIYILGLALFSGYFTLLDRYLLANNDLLQTNQFSTSLLSTVSRIVSNTNNVASNNLLKRNRAPENLHLHKKHGVLHLATWLHIFSLFLVILLFWTEFSIIGKPLNISQFFNYTTEGVLCHFKISSKDCGNLIEYGWIFIFAYSVFVITSMKLLILTQSAVYTVATMTVALPLVGIFWSIFHVAPLQNGSIIWAPSVTGELICSLLGLPVILIGLFLMCKSHFKDYLWSRRAATQVMSSNHLA